MDQVTRAALPAPAALRLRRPRWRDPRLLVGVLLVAASVAAGSWLVTAGQQTFGVYAAREALTPGQSVSAADLEVVQVRGERLAEVYLLASDELPSGALALRVIAGGELVPLSALGDAASLDVRSVAVPVGAELSAVVVPGSQVDLWFLPGSRADAPGEPRELARSLIVQEVAASGSGALGVGAGTVHVLVPADELGPVLAALGAEGTVRLVPVPGSGQGT